MKRLLIVGAGGHGKVAADIAMKMEQWEEIAFIDDNFPEKRKCLDFEVIGDSSFLLNQKKQDVFVAIGDNKIRETVTNELSSDCNTVTLIHPSAIIGHHVTIGRGSMIGANAVINTDTRIGEGVIVNTGTIIEHENIIDCFVHLSPNVVTGGQVSIGERTWVGLNTSIINNISIGSDIIIGAGSLVLRDVEGIGVYYGKVRGVEGE